MKKLIGIAVLVGMMAAFAAEGSAAGLRRAPADTLAKWVPAQAMLFVGYDGDNPAAKRTALYELMNEPEMKALLDGPLASLKKFVSAQALRKGGLDADVLEPLLNTKVGIAFLGIAPPAEEGAPPQPEIMLIVRVGKPNSAASKAARQLVDHLLKKAGLAPDAFVKKTICGVAAQVAKTDAGTMGYATVRGDFVFGTGNALAKSFDKAAAKLPDSKEFQRVSSLSGGNELLVIHYAYASFMRQFAPFVPRDVSKVLSDPAFGLTNLKSISAAFSPAGKGFRLSCFIHAPGEREGILKLLAGKPLNPRIIKLAPKETECFVAASLDPAALWDFVVANAPQTPRERERLTKEIAKANETLGFDLRKDYIGSLGDEFAVFGPGLIGVLKLKAPEKFKTCFNTMLMKFADEAGRNERAFRGAKLRLASMQYEGRTITYVDGTRLPMAIQPCYAMVGDYAVIALFPVSLKSYILRMAGGGTLADKPEFKALRAKLGPRPGMIYYGDTVGFVRSVYGYLPMLMGLAKMAPEEFQPLCPDPAKIPPFNTVSRHLFGSIAARRAVEDGIVFESYSPFGLPTPPQIRQGGGVATTAILAGMLLPALGRARSEARKVRDMSNLKQLGTAANIWLTKFGGDEYFPPSLRSIWDSEIVREPKLFVSPSTKTRSRAGEFATDYECIMDMLGFSPTESEAGSGIPMIWDKQGVHRGGRNVVYFDSHVTFMSEWQFQQLMEKTIKPFVAKMKKQFADKPIPEARMKAFRPRPMPVDRPGPERQRPRRRPALPFARAREEARKASDRSNLKQLGIAANIWLIKYGQHASFPPSFRSIWDGNIIKEPKIFVAPGSKTRSKAGEFATDYECILDMLGFSPTESEAGSAIPMAWNKKGIHRDGRNVVFFDSHVTFYSEAKFQELMAKTIKPFVAKMKKQFTDKPVPQARLKILKRIPMPVSGAAPERRIPRVRKETTPKVESDPFADPFDDL